MKAKLIFNLPEEQESFQDAVNASAMRACLFSIAMDIFRPARKHGYPDKRIQDLLDKEGVEEAIGLLEEEFYRLLQEHNLKI